MSTVTTPKTFNHEETQRKVRHPLHLLRKYIRRYIVLEGAALTLLFASLLFWAGLAVDFGLYKCDFDPVFGLDWILSLNDLDPSGASSLGIRVVLLGTIVVGLLYLGFTRVVARWFREFNDRALALVLERRFPKELGDRLITAVELADPRLSKRYGYSQAMVEKTIMDAVEKLKALPVAGVFNWRRLYGLWFLAGLSTVGTLAMTMIVFCIGSFFVGAKVAMSPVGFAWKFYDASSIWTERNVLMMDTYWPRRAYLEVGRFQRSKEDPNEMRVARDDPNRPDLQVRAYEWVIADRDREAAPHGWRALTWQDLSKHNLIEPALLARVKIAPDFDHWLLDPEELEPNLAAALFDTATHERSALELRKHFQLPGVKRKIDERGAEHDLNDWLDWRNWKLDKLALQKDEPRVADRLAELNSGDDLVALNEIIEQLEELAQAPSMSRRLRKLEIPEKVDVSFRGKMGSFTDRKGVEAGNKYTISLKDLKDSPDFRFRARGEDYFTRPKTITLVAAPMPARITIDKEEPAYIYHRLRGIDQMALRGEKHLTKNQALSITGESNTIEVPLGANLVIHVQTDRKLRQERAAFIKDNVSLPDGYDHYRGAPPVLDKDQLGFALVMDNLTRKHEFSVEFFDEDNIKGKRKFKILSVIDSEPQMGNLHVFGLNLRKPKFKAPEKGKDNDARDTRDLTELANSYLITADAVIPFECPVKDDYGLVRVGYQYKYRVEDFDPFAPTATRKAQNPDADQVSRRAGLAVSNFQFWPGNPQSWFFGPHFLAWTAQRVEQDLQQTQVHIDGYASAEGFRRLLERKDDKMIPPAAIKEHLTKRRAAASWEFDFKDDRNEQGEIGFDLRLHLPLLKTRDIEEFGQTHYALKISVQATDNNVETGAEYTALEGKKVLQLRGNTKRNKNGYINFLVISENELLAQIALEEETLFEKLEAAKEKVDAGKLSLQEQLSKIENDKNVDMENVLNRMNEIRTNLATSGSSLREGHQAYRNILEELRINRVKSNRVSFIRNKIYDPLENIVFQNPIFPNTGAFPNAEEGFQNAHQQVEKDVSLVQRPNILTHRKNMTDAEKQLNQLSREINSVLDAMSEGIVEAKLIAILASIERDQRNTTRLLQDMHTKQVLDILEKELGIGKKKDPPKEEKKSEEKKTSQNRGQRQDTSTTIPRPSASEAPFFREGNGASLALGLGKRPPFGKRTQNADNQPRKLAPPVLRLGKEHQGPSVNELLSMQRNRDFP